MGFYLRKSVSLGPFRFNLSKSGVGISAGIKGFRVGSGPRGNYVHMGRGGLYFRQSIPHNPKHAKPMEAVLQPETSTHTDLTSINTASALEVVDTSAPAVLNEINAKINKISYGHPTAIVFLVILYAIISSTTSIWPTIFTLAGGWILVPFAYYKDKIRKTTVILYEIDSEYEDLINPLYSAFDDLKSLGAIWHVNAEGHIYDKKYHAGANTLGPVEIHLEFMTAAARWIMAEKLSSVLSALMAIRLNSLSLQKKFSIK